MESTSRLRAYAPSAAALLVVYAAVLAITHSAMFARAPGAIAVAATVDLTSTATLAVWWLGVRPGRVPRWALLATLSAGVALAKAHVPHAPLGALVLVGIALEVASVTWLAIRLRRVARVVRRERALGPIDAVAAGLREARFPPLLAALLAAELAVLWLAVTGWFRRPAPGAYSMRSTGWLPVAGLIGFLLVGESAATHLLLGMASPLAAWLATASSAYALLWLVADAQAIRLYPVELVDGEPQAGLGGATGFAPINRTLHVRLGVRWRAAIPCAQIAAATRITSAPAGALSLALFEPTVLLELRAPVEVRGLLGRTRRTDRIALTVDEPDRLLAALAH